MLRVALSVCCFGLLAAEALVFASLAPAWCADTASTGSLMPPGIRAIPTLDDCAIILVSDPTNGAGAGVEWLGVGGAIACDADNSIIVWSTGYAPPPAGPITAPPPPPAPPTEPNQPFLWPEGIEYAVPFDVDNCIILGSEGG